MVYTVYCGGSQTVRQLGNWAIATYCMLATEAGLILGLLMRAVWANLCIVVTWLSRAPLMEMVVGMGTECNWAMRCSSSSLENLGSVTCLWPLGSSRAGRESEPQRLNASMFSPASFSWCLLGQSKLYGQAQIQRVQHGLHLVGRSGTAMMQRGICASGCERSLWALWDEGEGVMMRK